MNMKLLSQRFAHKILTVEEVVARVGTFPRDRLVTMCHGTFDVVHPGHLRHLLYAKGKGDVLVVGVTADRHVHKGDLRPHVPQDLRAVNLAAFEFVDFVIIDDHETPLEIIRCLKPDFFVKGFDYTQTNLNPKTEEEKEAVIEYGGQMLFSPGDFVLSSTRLIESSPPNLRYERLLSLMERSGTSFADLRSTVNAMTGVAVCLVGDTIVDSYTRCSMYGGQTKTPTLSVLYEKKDSYVGGAGVVAKHLSAAGANVEFYTLLGRDALAQFVLDDLASSGVETRPIRDRSRPTTEKNAIVVDQYRLLKVDTVDNSPVTPVVVGELCRNLSASAADIFVFSDFRHGIFHGGSVASLINALPPASFKVADSQVASRWGNILDFRGFDLITPNEREARFSLGNQDSNIGHLAATVYERAECKFLMLKLAERGLMTIVSRNEDSSTDFFLLDSMTSSVNDPVGAGDALLAYASLSLRVSGSIEQASILGSIAAACECEVDGNVPITADTVLARIDAIEKAANYLS